MAGNLRPDDSVSLVDSALNAARQGLSAWHISGDPKLLKRLENFTYEAGLHSRQRIVRVTEPSHRSTSQLDAELDWLAFLDRQGVGVSPPLPSASGALVETFDTDDGPFHVSVFKKALGRRFSFKRHWHAGFHMNLGELVGQMHAATRLYTPADGIQPRASWADDMNHIRQFIPKDETAARKEFDVMMEWASGLKIDSDSYGLVHADLNYSNLFVDEQGDLTVFDFDDCRYHWFAYDLAVPLFYAFIFFDMPSQDPSKQDWFYGPVLEGYSRHMVLEYEWLNRIPAFVRFRRIEIFAAAHKLLDMDNLSDWESKAMCRIREGFHIRSPCCNPVDCLGDPATGQPRMSSQR